VLFPTSPVTTLVSTYTRDDMYIFPLRCGAPGSYTVEINPLFDFGSIHTGVGIPLYTFFAPPIYVHYDVLAPVLSVSPLQNSVVFGPGQNTFAYTISNAGQGTLVWNVNTNAFPDWLFASLSGAAISACSVNSSQLVLGLNRANLPAILPVSHSFTINSNGGSFNVDVTVRPTALVITPNINNINLISPNNVFPLTLTNIDTSLSVNWTVLNTATLPAWLSFSQNSGTLNPSGQAGDATIVNLQIDNLNLPALPVSANFQIAGDNTIFNGTVTVN